MQHAWCSGVGGHSVLMSVAYLDVGKRSKAKLSQYEEARGEFDVLTAQNGSEVGALKA
jgi:hypothetical protein